MSQDGVNEDRDAELEAVCSELEDTPITDLTYAQACHAMQTGVAYELSVSESGDIGTGAATPKHLRTGVNSAMVNDTAMLRLLVKKGIITTAEYEEEIRLEMCREVDRYEARSPGMKFR